MRSTSSSIQSSPLKPSELVEKEGIPIADSKNSTPPMVGEDVILQDIEDSQPEKVIVSEETEEGEGTKGFLEIQKNGELQCQSVLAEAEPAKDPQPQQLASVSIDMQIEIWQDVSPTNFGRHVEEPGEGDKLDIGISPSRYSVLETEKEETEELEDGEVNVTKDQPKETAIKEQSTRPRLARATKGVNKSLLNSYISPAKDNNPSASGKRETKKNP